MPALRACCLPLLLWLCLACPAQAHTLITLTLDLVVEGDEVSLTLAVSPLDIIACLDPKGTSTRGELRRLAQVLGPYLLERLAVRADGSVLAGDYGGYLPDLLRPGAAAPAAEALPDKLSFVLTWKLPPGAARLTLQPTLFTEEKLPGFCQLTLEAGPGHARQVAYVELGNPWTFALSGTAPAAPLPPGMAEALVSGQGPPASGGAEAPLAFAPRLVGDLAAVAAFLPLLLGVVLAALQVERWAALGWSLMVLTTAALSGLTVAGVTGAGGQPVLGRALGLAAVLLLAAANLRQRADGPLGARLATLAILGLALGAALGAGLRAPPGAGLDPALLLAVAIAALPPGVAVALATAWSWGRAIHRSHFVVPLSVSFAALAALWALALLLPSSSPAG